MAQQITTCTAANTQNLKVAVTTSWTRIVSSTPTSCLRVKLIAPQTSHGGSANAGDVLVLLSATQPASTDGAEPIKSDGSTNNYFHVDDPRNVWIKGTASDALHVRIESQS